MIVYVDSSTVLKLVLVEAESTALRSWISSSSDTLVASQLVHTESHCGTRRRVSVYDPAVVDAAVAQLSIVPLEARDLRRAAAGPARLRAAEAIHLASAERLSVDAMLVYDIALAAAATASGLQVIAPR